MSGHKRATISLSQEEYRKLHEAEMRMRFLDEQSVDSSRRVREEVNQHLQSEIEQIQGRHQDLVEMLDLVNHEISSLEQEAGNRLIEQQIVIAQDVNELIDQYQVETTQAFASSHAQLQNQMDEILNQHHRERAWIESEWQRQASAQGQKGVLAREWLEAGAAIEEFILQHYRHEQFSPGSVERIETRLRQAQTNLAHQMPEAALSAAQDAYNQFSDLRLVLESLEAEQRHLVQMVKIKSQSILSLIENHKVVPAINLEGKVLPFQITVDYWTNGNLYQLENEYHAIVPDDISLDSASKDSLQDLLDQYFPYIEAKISDLVFEARLKVINAQLRVNIAQIVVQALATQGYELANSCFEAGDERTAYQANLINYEGSQILVQVDPVSDRQASNELNLFASDAQTKTAHELRQRALEIRRALQVSGLEVGLITATMENPIKSPNEGSHLPSAPVAPIRSPNKLDRQLQVHKETIRR
jgi:hypothetical protein